MLPAEVPGKATALRRRAIARPRPAPLGPAPDTLRPKREMHQNKKNSETPQSVPEPFARCPKGVLGYLQILGSGVVGSARTEGHCLFSYSPLYLLLVYAVVRAADTLTVIAIAPLLRSVHPLLFGPVRQPVHPATRLPADDDPIAIGECRFQFGRGILPTLGYFVHISTPPPNRKRFIFLNVT